jgi:2-methylcitrate dehydratase PrpD
MGLSKSIAEFIVALDEPRIPPDVLEKARTCLLIGYGIGLGCHETPFAPVARRAAIAMGGDIASGGATLLGDGRKSTIGGAALANAALFHGRGQEDTCGAAHLGAILIPLLTAMIEARNYPMTRLLPALVAGYETGGLFEKAYSARTTPSGLRSSAIYGGLAAAAAAAKLMNLSIDQTAAALSNVAAFSGGTLQSFDDGTDEWRYQVGVAGNLGLLAAELGRAGSVSAPHALEGRNGFVRAYARTDCDVVALLESLGTEWATRRVIFKPFPVCAFNQTPVTAALQVREKLGSTEVRRVRVRMNPYETGYAGMDSKGPFNSLSGTLMSIPFCIANTLVNGAPSALNMTRYDDAAVNALIARIDLVADDDVERLCCVIEVDAADGTLLVQNQHMTVADYAYDRATASALVRRVGAETGVPSQVYDRLEAFVNDPSAHEISEIVACFAALPRRESASESTHE